MSVIETRANWAGAWIKGIGAAFAEVENQAEKAYSLATKDALGVDGNKFTALFKERTSDKARETLANKTGVNYPGVTSEGEDYNRDTRLPGYKTEFNFIKKTQSIEVTEEERDDIDKVWADKLQEAFDLRVAAMMGMDKDAFSIFNYGFTAQASLPSHLTFYADGKPMLSVGHPRKDGGTAQSNASATGVPLTEPNLEVGLVALGRQLDDKGQPMAIGSGKVILLVPDALAREAVRITKSTKRQGTANNDLNVYEGDRVVVVSTKWINSQNGGSDTQWFLIDSMYSPLIMYIRRAITASNFMDNNNKNVIHDVSLRYQVGNKDWRGIWGSKGDSAAYSG